MKRQFFACLSILSAVALTACGGGSDGGSSDPIDKYIGSWGNCYVSGAASAKVVATFTKTSAATGNYSLVANGYASTNCSGAVAASSTDTGTAVLQGSKTIGAETVDKVIFTSRTDGPAKQVVVVRGQQQLLLGRAAVDGGPVDADGYPTTLDTSFVFIRQ